MKPSMVPQQANVRRHNASRQALPAIAENARREVG